MHAHELFRCRGFFEMAGPGSLRPGCGWEVIVMEQERADDVLRARGCSVARQACWHESIGEGSMRGFRPSGRFWHGMRD